MRLSALIVLFLAGGALGAPPEIKTEASAATATQVESSDWLAVVGSPHDRDVRSPNGKWHLNFIKAADLDVATYRVQLRSAQGLVMDLCSQALDATFAPDSSSVFVSTGPTPFLYVLKPPHRVMLTGVPSGLENNPVWVSSWPDGHHLVLHQQRRYDSKEGPKIWKVTLL